MNTYACCMLHVQFAKYYIMHTQNWPKYNYANCEQITLRKKQWNWSVGLMKFGYVNPLILQKFGCCFCDGHL